MRQAVSDRLHNSRARGLVPTVPCWHCIGYVHQFGRHPLHGLIRTRARHPPPADPRGPTGATGDPSPRSPSKSHSPSRPKSKPAPPKLTPCEPATSSAPATAPTWPAATTWPSTRITGWSPPEWKPTGTAGSTLGIRRLDEEGDLADRSSIAENFESPDARLINYLPKEEDPIQSKKYMRRFVALPWGRNWALQLRWRLRPVGGPAVWRGGLADTSRAAGQG